MSRTTHDGPGALRSTRPGRRGALVALFALYLGMLVWVVLWKLELPHLGDGTLRRLKLVPFAPTDEDGASRPAEVIANLLLFVPFGLYLGVLVPSWRWWQVAGICAGASLALEITQYIAAVGSSDATDVIVNTAGGLAGLALLVVTRHRLEDRTGAIMTRVCAIGTALFLLVAGLFIASPLRHAPPRHAESPMVSMPSGAPVHGERVFSPALDGS
jgi:glycopeptide antibiotics resistance protein